MKRAVVLLVALTALCSGCGTKQPQPAPLVLNLPDCPAPQAPPGSEKFMTLIGLGKWIALIICVFAIILGAALWAIHARRGEDSDGINKVGIALIAVIIISFAASVVGWLGGF